MHRTLYAIAIPLVLVLEVATNLSARQWKFVGIPDPLEAEFVTMQNDYVVLKGPNDKSFEIPLASFSPADRKFIQALAAGESGRTEISGTGKPIIRKTGYTSKSVDTLKNRMVSLGAASELHITGKGDPIVGSSFDFTAPDGWLFFDHIAPSVVKEKFLNRILVGGRRASFDKNIRIVPYGEGAVVIPHARDFPAMTVFQRKDLAGDSLPLECYVKYGEDQLSKLKGPVASFILKRGYMATLAENENGTGTSRNFVAQDHDIVVDSLPKGLDESLRFVRIFPWRWTSKKGIAGGIWQNLNVGWFYDWNIGAQSSLDLEYVAIKQKRWWPGMDQDWRDKGINHLLGYNEPDHKDQSNLSVDDAIAGWPELLGTGLRLGSPAVSDGGLGWLYQFMEKADAKNLRVDFVAVHYYRAAAPGDARGAANQMRGFLEGIHNRVKRPIWITEWNNGANWTNAGDPNERQQKAAIAAMIEMLDDAPFVERYALYNWVEDCRAVKRGDGSLTPAGEVYRDKESPVFFTQPRSTR